jgi:AcrR family transcriptional regulator
MDPMPPLSRAEIRAETTRAIQAAGRRHLADVGPAALSLRAIAREVGLVSSAVYRYFPSRDDLLTALIVESYDELGAAVEAAERGVADRDDLTGRFAAVCRAVRDWARTHPHEYALIYGSPVPGYAAPADTVPPAMRISGTFLGVVADAQRAGRRTPATTEPDAEESAAIAPVLAMSDPPLEAAAGLRALIVWATLFGHLSQELFGHLHQGVLDYDVHFDRVVAQLAVDLGLDG